MERFDKFLGVDVFNILKRRGNEWKILAISVEAMAIFQERCDMIRSKNVTDMTYPHQWRIPRYTMYTGGITNFGGLNTLMKCVSSLKKILRFLNVSPTN